MQIVYGIIRWTNSSRAGAKHIDNGEGKPLCNDKRKVFCWQKDIGEPTCKKCLAPENFKETYLKYRFILKKRPNIINENNNCNWFRKIIFRNFLGIKIRCK